LPARSDLWVGRPDRWPLGGTRRIDRGSHDFAQAPGGRRFVVGGA
jgi:hypothetical protein